jgi:hypothetical protein
MFSKEELQLQLLTSLNQLLELPESYIFQQPVDSAAVPRYKFVISNPMDFGQIKMNILHNAYRDAWEYVNDVRLVFSNATTFNKKNTLVYDYSIKVHFD